MSNRSVIPSEARDLGACLRHQWFALHAETKVPRFARDDSLGGGVG
jgi:hypothetical protein